MLKPFPKRKKLDSFKLQEFVDDNSKFDKNGRKFSELDENTVAKGEIARYERKERNWPSQGVEPATSRSSTLLT